MTHEKAKAIEQGVAELARYVMCGVNLGADARRLAALLLVISEQDQKTEVERAPQPDRGRLSLWRCRDAYNRLAQAHGLQ